MTKSWDINSCRLIWHRHEIENYLLDWRVVSHAFQKIMAAQSRIVLPVEQEEIEQLLCQKARLMLENQAGWAVWYEIIQSSNDRQSQLNGPNKSSLLERSIAGANYPDRTGWLSYLQTESMRFQTACNRAYQDPRFTISEIEQLYDQQCATLLNPGFLTSGNFLLDLPGKELLNDLYLFVHNQYPRLTKDDFVERFINALAEIYYPGFYAPDDFEELSKRLM